MKLTTPRLFPRLSRAGFEFNGALPSTETVRTVRYLEPRTATSTFTRLPSSEYQRLWVELKSSFLVDFVAVR